MSNEQRTITGPEFIQRAKEGNLENLGPTTVTDVVNLANQLFEGNVILQNLTFQEPVDLSRVRVKGDVTISDCVFEQGLSLYQARLEKGLTLVNTRIPGHCVHNQSSVSLHLAGLHIDGPWCVTACTVAGRVHARHVRIGDELSVDKSKFNDHVDLSGVRAHGEVMIRDCTFGQGLILAQGYMEKGLTLTNTTIPGHCVHNQSSASLHLAGLHIDGPWRVTDCTVAGSVHAPHVRIGDELSVDKSKFNDHVDLSGVRVHGKVTIRKCNFDKTLNLKDARLQKDLKLDQVDIMKNNHEEQPGDGLDMTGVHIKGEWTSTTLQVGGHIHADHARVTGHVTFQHLCVKGDLQLNDAWIGGQLVVDARKDEAETKDSKNGNAVVRQSTIEGNWNLTGARVEGLVYARGLQLHQSFNAEAATLNGGLVLETSENGTCRIEQNVNLNHAYSKKPIGIFGCWTGGNLLMQDMTLRHALVAFPWNDHPAHVEGDWNLSEAIITGPIDVMQAKISGKILQHEAITPGLVPGPRANPSEVEWDGIDEEQTRLILEEVNYQTDWVFDVATTTIEKSRDLIWGEYKLLKINTKDKEQDRVTFVAWKRGKEAEEAEKNAGDVWCLDWENLVLPLFDFFEQVDSRESRAARKEAFAPSGTAEPTFKLNSVPRPALAPGTIPDIQKLTSEEFVKHLYDGMDEPLTNTTVFGRVTLTTPLADRVVRVHGVHFRDEVDFSEARFPRTLDLTGCTFAKGLSLANARIDANLVLKNVKVLNAGSYGNKNSALDLTHVHIQQGDVGANDIVVEGDFATSDAIVSGSFSCPGMRLKGFWNGQFSQLGHLIFSSEKTRRTRIGGNLNFLGATVKGQVQGEGAWIGGRVFAQGATVEGGLVFESTDTYRTELEGDFDLAGATVKGQVQCSSIRVAGFLSFFEATVGALFVDVDSNELQEARRPRRSPFLPEACGFVGHNLTVKGNLRLHGLHLHGTYRWSTLKLAWESARGCLDLVNARIDGDVSFWSEIYDRLFHESPPTISHHHLSAGGQPYHGFIAKDLDVSRTRIGGRLFLSNVVVRGRILLNHTIVGANLRCLPFAASDPDSSSQSPSVRCGHLSMRLLECSGDVDLTGLAVDQTLPPDSNPSWQGKVDARNVVVKGELRFSRQRSNSRDEVDGHDAVVKRELHFFQKCKEMLQKGTSHVRAVLRRLCPLFSRRELTNNPCNDFLPADYTNIPGSLNLSACEVSHMVLSGHSFAHEESEDAEVDGIVLERAKIRRLEIPKPFPVPLDLSNIEVDWWDICRRSGQASNTKDLDVKPYLELLGKDKRFKQRTYKLIEASLRNQGYEAEANQIYIAMKDKARELEQRKLVKGWNWAWGQALWYGTNARPLVVCVMLPWLLVSCWAFHSTTAVQFSSAAYQNELAVAALRQGDGPKTKTIASASVVGHASGEGHIDWPKTLTTAKTSGHEKAPVSSDEKEVHSSSPPIQKKPAPIPPPERETSKRSPVTTSGLTDSPPPDQPDNPGVVTREPQTNTDNQNFAPQLPQSGTSPPPKNPHEEIQRVPSKHPPHEVWGWGNALLLAIRYHVPIIGFFAMEEFEASTESFHLGIPFTNSFPPFPFTNRQYAAVTSLVHWIFWPLVLATMTGIVRKRQ